MSRLPIRVRLTLPFALAMAAVLVATGAFVYLRVGHELLASVDTNLSAQAREAKQNAGEGHELVDPDGSDGPVVAAVERRDGTVIRSSRAKLQIPLRGSPDRRERFTTRLAGLHGEWRVIEVPATVDGAPATIAVARSLAARDDTLHRLAREFLLAAPIALLLAVAAGYGLAAAALRPVEAMRRRASSITGAETGRRLPVPAANDEIRALAVTLNDMLDRLELALEHERRFLSDASHELRTPLALLRTELDLALRRPRTHAELERALRSAAEDTERLTRLAEDLLLLARADQGRLPIRPERVDAAELLQRVQQRFATRSGELGRTISIDASPATIVDADALRLEQALENLVANAIDHGDGPVTLRAERSDGHLVLHVLDEGPGYDERFVARAFDRFSRADDARSAGGTGLGLAIVALIAQAHGGSAQVANRPHGGSDASISLPSS
jgi:signal transduction histidine kinase